VPWEWPAGALCAFLLTLVTTPAGVSAAVLLLLPIQLSILHVPSPAVTPTTRSAWTPRAIIVCSTVV
jgi:hypothetical protein